jgi:hypothetical protein
VVVVVAMPGPGAGDTRAVELALIAAQFMAVAAQLAAFFAHFVAIANDYAVDGVGTGIGSDRTGMGLGHRGGHSGGQREERGCQQKLAHRILLQKGSLACDHR